jgi:cell division protein FtsW (lipid II flippase)
MGSRLNDSVFILTLLLIYLLTAIGLTHSGSSTVHIYTQTIHRTQLTTLVEGFLGFEPRMVKLKLTIKLKLCTCIYYIIILLLIVIWK